MAVLSDADRHLCYKQFSDYLSTNRIPSKPSKQQFRAAINAIDVSVDNNRTSFNNAIPEPCKSLMTTKQKAQMLMYVVSKRWEVEI
jgi:hypothetical protein